jgi:hypothetical protein
LFETEAAGKSREAKEQDVEKTACTQVELETGLVDVYDFGNVKLHAYRTGDPIDDEVFVVEKDGRGFVIEYPCFFDSIRALEEYVARLGIAIEGIVAAYHMAGASFLGGTPVYATKEADAYGHVGGGRALIDGFAEAFGEAFDASIATVTNVIESDEFELAGVHLRIVRNAEAFDLELPDLNVAYTHMLGHDCHSIVAGAGHADALIAQLEGYLDRGFDLVLTSHYTPEDLKDVQAKIDYLRELKDVAAVCASAEEFKEAVRKRNPGYAGDNYLEMTSGFFFA